MDKISEIDVTELLRHAPEHGWCIVKLPEAFPFLRRNADVDIFCYSIQEFCEYILPHAIGIAERHGVQLLLNDVHAGRCHLDFIKEGSIELRIDLCDSRPPWARVQLKESFIESVIYSATSSTVCDKEGQSLQVRIPTMIDEAIIRYVEYANYYWTGPDKIHHLKWIENQIPIQDRDAFFRKLHRYTAIPSTQTQISAREIRKIEINSLNGRDILSILFKKIRNRIRDPFGSLRLLKALLTRHKA